MATHVHLAALLFLATSPLSAQTTSAAAPTLIGQGRGVDHVGVGVRDLAQAEHDYELLGFRIAGRKHFPEGVSDSHAYFRNNSYLELVTVSGSATTGMATMLADFLKRDEGAMFLGINVASAKAAANYLRARNFAVSDPEPGSSMEESQTTLPPPLWYTFGPDKPTAGKRGITVPMFFIEYVSDDLDEKLRAAGDLDHPNTAIRIHSVWFAVHDAEAQLRLLEDAGFEAGSSRVVELLGARGREVKAGQGALLLLEASSKDGLLAKYLSDRVGCNCPVDEGVIGLSLEVADLDKARRLAETRTGGRLETYQGFYGTSFMLTPSVTHGVWMEMYQPAKHAH